MSVVDRGGRLGGNRDYNHATDPEYKALRTEADRLYQKRQQLLLQSQQAFKAGDKLRAHDLSMQLKLVLAQAEDANRRAAEWVFRENNADSAEDEIDLHGLYVKEAEYILQNRLAAALRTNQSHLKVIVGKGLHLQGGIAKLKPAIDQLCRDARLQHHIDKHNLGVMVIDLHGANESQIPHKWTIASDQQQFSQPQYQPQPQYQQQPPHGGDSGIKTGNQLLDLVLKMFCACIK